MAHLRPSLAHRALGMLLGLMAWGGVAAQDLSIPTGWNAKFDGSDTRAVREAYANGAAAALVANITSSGSLYDRQDSQTLSSMYNVLALQDIASGNSTWKDAVLNNMHTWISNIDIYTNGTSGAQRTNSNGMLWALSFYYAYKAYGDSTFLDQAKQAFDTTSQDYIDQDIASGSSNGGRNASLGACRSNAVGGIFWLPDDPSNVLIHTYAVGPYAILAGLLYEETHNSTYRDLAAQTVTFMGGLNFDSSNGIEYDVYDLGHCGDTGGVAPGLQGWYIYALSIYASIVDGDNSSYLSKLRTAVSTAATFKQWVGSNGVISDTDTNKQNGNFDDKAFLVRGMNEVLRRFPDQEDLVQYIQGFLTVQYNAATQTARKGNSYSASLVDGAPSTYSDAGNLVAIDILNAAFPISPSESKKSTPVGAIVGGVVGGVAGLALLAGAVFWWWRRKHPRRSASPMLEPFDGDKLVDPNYQPPANAEGASSAPAHRTNFTVEPFIDSPGRTSQHPMSWPQYNGSQETGLSGTTLPYTGDKARQSVGLVPRAPVGYSSKLARMNAPPPRPAGASSPSTMLSVGDRASSVDTGGPEQDLSTLVNQLVNNALRQHGTVPPEYEESVAAPRGESRLSAHPVDDIP
ncbi:unnamed protein product [Peniophora sp. CBMAI 1063]|nr:unnamed protein product [Peniophora sp. CBMAI 1063]